MTDFTMSMFRSKDDMTTAMREHIAKLEAQLEAIGAVGVERLSSGGESAKTPQAEGADWFIVIDPSEDGDGAVFAYDADLGREFGHEHIKDAQERDDPRASRWVVRPAYAARAPAPAAVEPVASEDDYKAWYIEAMVASNEAGIVGMSAADTIRYLATPNAEPAPVAGCPECHITHDLGACAKASPADALDAKRLDWMIEQRAYVVCDSDCCDGYWLHFSRPDGSTWVQWDEHHSPRAAIDAAMAAQAAQKNGGV